MPFLLRPASSSTGGSCIAVATTYHGGAAGLTARLLEVCPSLPSAPLGPSPRLICESLEVDLESSSPAVPSDAFDVPIRSPPSTLTGAAVTSFVCPAIGGAWAGIFCFGGSVDHEGNSSNSNVAATAAGGNNTHSSDSFIVADEWRGDGGGGNWIGGRCIGQEQQPLTTPIPRAFAAVTALYGVSITIPSSLPLWEDAPLQATIPHPEPSTTTATAAAAPAATSKHVPPTGKGSTTTTKGGKAAVITPSSVITPTAAAVEIPVIPTYTPPPPPSAPPAFTCTILLFGGTSPAMCLDSEGPNTRAPISCDGDVWVIDASTALSCADAGNPLIWSRAPIDLLAPAPGPRSRHTLTTTASGHSALLFGGFGYSLRSEAADIGLLLPPPRDLVKEAADLILAETKALHEKAEAAAAATAAAAAATTHTKGGKAAAAVPVKSGAGKVDHAAEAAAIAAATAAAEELKITNERVAKETANAIAIAEATRRANAPPPGPLNDVWVLNASQAGTWVWSHVQAFGPSPIPRFSHAVASTALIADIKAIAASVVDHDAAVERILQIFTTHKNGETTTSATELNHSAAQLRSMHINVLREVDVRRILPIYEMNRTALRASSQNEHVAAPEALFIFGGVMKPSNDTITASASLFDEGVHVLLFDTALSNVLIKGGNSADEATVVPSSAFSPTTTAVWTVAQVLSEDMLSVPIGSGAVGIGSCSAKSPFTNAVSSSLESMSLNEPTATTPRITSGARAPSRGGDEISSRTTARPSSALRLFRASRASSTAQMLTGPRGVRPVGDSSRAVRRFGAIASTFSSTSADGHERFAILLSGGVHEDDITSAGSRLAKGLPGPLDVASPRPRVAPPNLLVLEFTPSDDVPALMAGAYALSSVHDGFGGHILRPRTDAIGVLEKVRRRYYDTGDAAITTTSMVSMVPPPGYSHSLPLPTYQSNVNLVAEYEGESDAGVRHGQGVMKWYNSSASDIGAVSYAGAWRADAPHGYGVLVEVTGREHEGLLSDSKPHGRGRSVWPPTPTQTQGSSSTPPLTLLDPSAPVSTIDWTLGLFDGDWVTGEPFGEGAGVYHNGVKFEGTWANGLPHGQGILTAIIHNIDTVAEEKSSVIAKNTVAALGISSSRASAQAGGPILTLYITGTWSQGRLHGESCVWQLLAGVPSAQVFRERANADAIIIGQQVTNLSFALSADSPRLASPKPYRDAVPSDSFASARNAVSAAGTTAATIANIPSLRTASVLLQEASLRISEQGPSDSPPCSTPKKNIMTSTSTAASASESPIIAHIISRLPEGATLVEAYIGGFVDGVREGISATSTTSDASVFTGTYRSGRRNGFGTLRSADGSVFSGKFIAGEAEGKGTLVTAAGTIENGCWSTPRTQGGGPRTPGRTTGTASGTGTPRRYP